MMINTNNLVSITEANQNFSKIARMVDESGSVVILKNNVPKYLLVEFNEADKPETASVHEVKFLSQKIINRNLNAFKEIAK